MVRRICEITVTLDFIFRLVYCSHEDASFYIICLNVLEGINRRVAEIQIFEKTYLIVIKDETGLKFKINDSTLFLIGSYAQKLVASY